MFKKKMQSIIVIIFTFLLTGCWDYVNLDEITIVAGIAIDKNKENNMYHLTFEIIDIPRSSKLIELKSTIVESEGRTIFDAIRNSKKRLENKPFFPAAEIVVVSHQIAKEEGLSSIFDMFLRNQEARETITYAISKEVTAKEILMANPVIGTVQAYEIRKIIKEDNFVTSSTNYTESAKLFNILEGEGKSLVIANLSKTPNDNSMTIESDGMSVFKKDKLIGYIDPDESKYHLFITNNIKGGIINLEVESKNGENVSLEIHSSTTTKLFKYKSGKLTIKLKLKTEVFIGEASDLTYPLKKEMIKDMEKKAAYKIENGIKELVKKAQTEFKTDIFSFGCLIYQNDPKLWEKLKKNWDEIFKNLEIEINSDVHAMNSAFIR